MQSEISVVSRLEMMLDRAQSHINANGYERALQTFMEALEIAHQNLGPEHRLSLQSLRGAGECLKMVGPAYPSSNNVDYGVATGFVRNHAG